MKKWIFETPYFELIFWSAALIGLWYMDPYLDHFSLCPLDNLGMAWCPGCGFGRSIGLLLKGELAASWSLHPLGGFGLSIIIFRVFELVVNIKTAYEHGKCTKAPSGTGGNGIGIYTGNPEKHECCTRSLVCPGLPAAEHGH